VTPIAQRWLKFNFVGAIGIAVQLAAFTLYNGTGMNYLVATALAVETAVLHNFVWHERFTWRGLPAGGRWRRLLKFHAGNGLISIAGNLALMRLFVGVFHIHPYVVANVMAIAVCAVGNFLVSEFVVFRREN
jgi:dolichol-phosphate mannosyltransferase